MLKLLSTRMCHSHRGMLEAEIRLWVTTFPLTTVLKKLTSFSIQRPLWRHYYQNTEALMFVVDSNDRERIGEVRDELWRFLAEDELQDCVVLIMANKQDLPNAMSVEQITDKLELNKIKDKTWCKLNISAHTSYKHVHIMIRHLFNFHRYTAIMCHIRWRAVQWTGLVTYTVNWRSSEKISNEANPRDKGLSCQAVNIIQLVQLTQ